MGGERGREGKWKENTRVKRAARLDNDGMGCGCFGKCVRGELFSL